MYISIICKFTFDCTRGFEMYLQVHASCQHITQIVMSQFHAIFTH